MGIFNTKQSLEEMLEKINNSVPETIHIGAVFINYKLQKELLDSQKKYNRKQLIWSRMLALATIALVLVTLLLVKFG